MSAFGAAPAPEAIEIRGAREHNLRDLDLDLPRDALVVVTGLSGSGKSSLAFDTLYAEGQRRYVESLSAYARQFLDQMSKPDVDSIEGLSPAIAIEQKTANRSPRSTVGTVTEIYDYLRLLYARAGDPHCWECGEPITSQTVDQMAERVLGLPDGARAWILAPVVRGRKGTYKKEFERFRQKGFVRVRVDGEMLDLGDEIELARGKLHDIDVVVDRVAVKPAAQSRLAESISAALDLADGLVRIVTDAEEWMLSRASACRGCSTSFPEIAPRTFSFNSPSGACPGCKGLGERYSLDPERVAPDPGLPLSKAITAWSKGKGARYYKLMLEALARHFEVSLDTAWGELPKRARDGILHGTGGRKIELELARRGRRRAVEIVWDGVLEELERRAESDEAQARALARYRSPRPCEECGGARLRREARHVLLGGDGEAGQGGTSRGQASGQSRGLGIDAVARLPIDRLGPWLDSLGERLAPAKRAIADRILVEIRERCRFLCEVGLGYLTLHRPSATLSGGESQRIRLATQIGSSLMGVLYILDEPSIGLHARDCDRLLASLVRLRDIGNTVVVVEHDETTMRRADQIIDMGPGAGIHGGEVVAQGTPAELQDGALHPKSLTGAYLSGRRAIALPEHRRSPNGKFLEIAGCSQHNLRDVTLRVPLGCLTVVTGVSGSGKSTLVRDTLHRALAARLHGAEAPPGRFESLSGIEHLDKVIDVDQSPIGRTPRSNPATYVGAFDSIRKLFAQVPESRMRGYEPGRFSFNVKGGRCESCQGDGAIRVEMSFLPDWFVQCEVCGGRRYDRETLEITYKERSIADVLAMTVEEAVVLFENSGSVARPLRTLEEVGLGYLGLGQSATTLSGGEAQRVKLARELSKRATGRTLYLLDEPTTGLHFVDIEKLLELLHRLVSTGNTVVVVEHQLDVVASADHVIDLGPEGGEAGGEIVVQGTPEEVALCERSHTGSALRSLLSRHATGPPA